MKKVIQLDGKTLDAQTIQEFKTKFEKQLSSLCFSELIQKEKDSVFVHFNVYIEDNESPEPQNILEQKFVVTQPFNEKSCVLAVCKQMESDIFEDIAKDNDITTFTIEVEFEY